MPASSWMVAREDVRPPCARSKQLEGGLDGPRGTDEPDGPLGLLWRLGPGRRLDGQRDRRVVVDHRKGEFHGGIIAGGSASVVAEFRLTRSPRRSG
jgi:hypothetical protein